MENIEVSVRVRPLNSKERAHKEGSVWQVEENGKTISLQPKILPSPQSAHAKASHNNHHSPNNKVNPFCQTSFTSQQNTVTFGMGSSTSPISNSKNKTQSPFNKQKDKKNTNQKSWEGGESRWQQDRVSQYSIGNTSSQSSLQSNNSFSMTQQTNSSLAGTEQKKKVQYSFDQCFKEEDFNQLVYHSTVKRIALSSLNGINGTIFVYGQTGSGKTFTMLGRERKEVMQDLPQAIAHKQNMAKKEGGEERMEEMQLNEASYLSGRKQAEQQEDQGVMIFALEEIFQEIKQDQEKTFFLRCSYTEIYNEQVYDLLRDQDSINESLSLNEDKNKDFYVKGVIEEPVSSIEEILYFLRRGELNRHYAQTKLNHSSSRSHTLFRVHVQSITNNFIDPVTQEKSPQKIQNKKFVTQSVLNFVDLAGSEKVSSHYENKGNEEVFVQEFGEQTPKIDEKVQTRIKEGKNINKSLFFLTQVISMRAEGKSASSQHIPYRNSPLTKILRSSLGGNSRTTVIVCVTPCSRQIEQTISSLRFGQNAMKIENKVQANIIANNNEEAVKILIADYERKIKYLEKTKKDQQNKKNGELQMIDMLLDEKRRMQDRINQVAHKKFKQMLKSSDKCHLLDYKPLEWASQRSMFMVNMQNVGILEVTERLGQQILSLHDKKGFEQSLKRGSGAKAKPEHPYTEKGYQQMALDIIRISKEQALQSQEKIGGLQKVIQELTEKNSLMVEELTVKETQLQQSQDFVKKLGVIVEELKGDNDALRMKESFYERFDPDYIQRVKDEWLLTLEGQFSRIIEKIKEERARRHYKDKMQVLKKQIVKLQEIQESEGEDCGDQQKAIQGILNILQQSECQSMLEKESKSNQNQSYQQKEEFTVQEQEPQIFSDPQMSFSFKREGTSEKKEDRITNLKDFRKQSEIEFSEVIEVQLKDQFSSERKDDENFQTKESNCHSQASMQVDPDKKDELILQCDNIIQQMSQVKDPSNQISTLKKLPNASGEKKERMVQRNAGQKKIFRNQSMHNIGKRLVLESLSNNKLRSNEKRARPSNLLLKIASSSKQSQRKGQQSSCSPAKPFQEDQQVSLNFFGTFNHISPHSVAASSTLNNFVQADLEHIQVNQFGESERKENSDVNLLKEEGSSTSKEVLVNINTPQQKSNKRESFAMSNRESNEELHSNNLFETLQGNIDEFGQSELIINANEYVSFKQASANKKTFALEEKQNSNFKNGSLQNLTKVSGDLSAKAKPERVSKELAQALDYKKQLAKAAQPKALKDKLAKKIMRENKKPSLSPLSKAHISSMKLDSLQSLELPQMSLGRSNLQISPNQQLEGILTQRSLNAKSSGRESCRESKGKGVKCAQQDKKKAQKGNGFVFQYTRLNEGKVFQPLLSKNKLQIDVGLSRGNHDPSPKKTSLTPKLKKKPIAQSITPRL